MRKIKSGYPSSYEVNKKAPGIVKRIGPARRADLVRAIMDECQCSYDLANASMRYVDQSFVWPNGAVIKRLGNDDLAMLHAVRRDLAAALTMIDRIVMQCEPKAHR